jgi:hypothetical protein
MHRTAIQWVWRDTNHSLQSIEQSMKSSKLLGAVLIVVGIGLLGYWVDCNFWHPTREVLQRRANQADYGGVAALSPDPTKIFLLGGVVAFAAGSYYLKQ